MKKHIKLTGLLLCFFCAYVSLIGCSSNPASIGNSNEIPESAVTSSSAQTSDAFETLTKDLFIDYASSDALTLNYTLKNPSSYDIALDEVTWGDVPVTEDDFLPYKESTQDNLRRLNAISDLSEDQALTYDVLSYYLNLELEGYDYIYFTDNFSSQHGVQSQLPIVLAEYAFDTAEDVEDYLTLLNHIGFYFDQLIAFENEKACAGYGMCISELLASIDECKAFCAAPDTNMLIEIFPSKLEHLHLSETEKNAYIQSNKEAVLNQVLPAYQKVMDALNAQLDTAPENGSLAAYENGTAYYTYLLKSSVGTDKTPEELIRQTESKLLSSMTALSILFTKNENIYDALSRSEFPMDDPEEILEHFNNTLVKDLFPEGPAVSYSLETVHESLADILSPAMYFIPRIDDIKNNRIYLNLENNDSSNDLMPTLAHEGYPGHMYQITYYYNTRPDPIRTVYECKGYSEGWASYVESLAYDYCGFSEDVAAFNRISNLTLGLNLYCRLDLGIHYENWSFEDMAAYTTQYLALDNESLKQIYDAILYNPANYLIYGIGMNEICEIRDTMQKNLGEDFSLKDFHQELLDLGPAPFPVIKKHLMHTTLNAYSDKAA